jgi:hypothetical protein
MEIQNSENNDFFPIQISIFSSWKLLSAENVQSKLSKNENYQILNSGLKFRRLVNDYFSFILGILCGNWTQLTCQKICEENGNGRIFNVELKS